MCILCGDFVNQVHWTDRGRARTSGETVVVGEMQRDRQRDRYRKTQLANQILKYYGLRMEDWTGSKFIVRDMKGNSEVIHDIGQLWYAAERLTKREPNPLDSGFIDFMKSS